MGSLEGRSRREFLKTSAAAGSAGLILGIVLPDAHAQPAAEPGAAAMPNAWVKIGRDDSITILSARSEMGQGVYTALPTLVAEELEVDLAKVKVEIAPPGEVYINAMLGGQITGGSTSVPEGYDKLRIAGAQARTMLVAAAAQRWNVDASACRAEDGTVQGPGGRRASYGELAEAASKLAVPKDVKLKEHRDSRYVGKPIKRLDTPGKTNGSAEFGIDVKLPGLLYASLAQCPVIGGKVKSLEAAKARSMPGVRHVVQVTDGVAVVAVFGSYVRDEQKRESDIDLLAEILRPISLLELAGAEIYLSEILGARVDLVPKRSVREELKETIFKEAIAL